MADGPLLERIHANPWIAELLVEFDFDLDRAMNGPPEPVRLSDDVPLEMIAGDAAGGAFMLVGAGSGSGTDEDRPVVYVGSEGEGGLIASRLRDAIALVVGLPSLHDAMAGFPEGRSREEILAHLREADDALRAEWPDLDADRERLRRALDLPPAEQLLDALYAAAADESYRPISEHGDRYSSML